MSCSPTPAKKMRISVNGFQVGELETYFMPTLKYLIDHTPESIPFLVPVDPVLLKVPHYFDVIKSPMDLSTIKKKLETGVYNDPWEFADDIWLMFNNAWTFNNKNHYVYKYCTKLSEEFEPEIDRLMRMLGYCCGRSYNFLAQTLCCFGKDGCLIRRNEKYFALPDSRTFCVRCFDELPEYNDSKVDLTDHTYSETFEKDTRRIFFRKSLCVEATNNEVTPEAFVNCVNCKRKFHKICVLQMDCIWAEGYRCTNCSNIMNITRPANKYNAEGLCKTKLGDHVEQRVKRFLNQENREDIKVTVRVLSSLSKSVQVKEGMKVRYVDKGEMSDKFPYISKSIFAFEEIDGVDVCFFGMHVQEYGPDSPPPNAGRVYISYLDSVQLFRPDNLRTLVYHEILLGYLEYVKKMGYNAAHIWACPPQNGDDYIFHGHPPTQKIQTTQRLLAWYNKMLNKGNDERIVVKYNNIYDQAMDDQISCASQFPYFDGDFWSDKLEELTKQIDHPQSGKSSKPESMAWTQTHSSSSENEFEKSSPGQQKGSKNKPPEIIPSDDLTAKLFSFMKYYHKDFLVVTLQSTQKRTIRDPDPFIVCDLMDGRDSFLLLAKEKHFDFSSLRRGKYGTMVMLYEIHKLAKQEDEYVCNWCGMKIKTRFHCTVCEDFDLCIHCNQKDVHTHKVQKLDTVREKAPIPVAKVCPTRRSRPPKTPNYDKLLFHASECKDNTCRVDRCHDMKWLIQHIRGPCPKRIEEGGCRKCMQCLSIIYSHVKICKKNRSCPVAGCLNFKLKIWQKSQHHQLRYDPTWRQKLRQQMQSAFCGVSSAPNVNVHPAATQVIQNTCACVQFSN